jgi:hypothetical protein
MTDFALRGIFGPIPFVLLIGCTVGCGTGYQRLDGKWHYVTIDEGHGRRARELPVDTDSFTVLSGGIYAKDKNSVFFNGRLIEDADPFTFTPLPRITSPLIRYSKDVRHVYLNRLRVIGADPSSFRVVDGPYSRDDRNFYCGCVPMDVANPDRFEVVYWSGIVEMGGDSLVESYGPAFEQIDATIIVAEGWARDGEYYYCGPRRITDRDYATIEVVSASKARDKDGEFWGDLMYQPVQQGKEG